MSIQVSGKTMSPQSIVEPMNYIVISSKLPKLVNTENKKNNENVSLAMFC